MKKKERKCNTQKTLVTSVYIHTYVCGVCLIASTYLHGTHIKVFTIVYECVVVITYECILVMCRRCINPILCCFVISSFFILLANIKCVCISCVFKRKKFSGFFFILHFGAKKKSTKFEILSLLRTLTFLWCILLPSI